MSDYQPVHLLRKNPPASEPATAPVAPPSNRVRVLLTPANGSEAVASVWASLGESEAGPTLTLEHDYPNVRAGWTVEGRNLLLTVVAVDGRVLTCQA